MPLPKNAPRYVVVLRRGAPAQKVVLDLHREVCTDAREGVDLGPISARSRRAGRERCLCIEQRPRPRRPVGHWFRAAPLRMLRSPVGGIDGQNLADHHLVEEHELKNGGGSQKLRD